MCRQFGVIFTEITVFTLNRKSTAAIGRQPYHRAIIVSLLSSSARFQPQGAILPGLGLRSYTGDTAAVWMSLLGALRGNVIVITASMVEAPHSGEWCALLRVL